MRNQFRAMLASGQPSGTVLRQAGSLALWWSPLEWHSPADGLKAQPGKWLWLGTEGWYYLESWKADFLRLVARCQMPQYPNEWVMLNEAAQVQDD